MRSRFIESNRWVAVFNSLKVFHLESWQRGEVEDIPDHLKEPDILYYNPSTLSHLSPNLKQSFVEKEFYFLKNTNLHTLNLIQKKSFKHGYPPSCGALLMLALEYARLLNHRSRETRKLTPYYKHHKSILMFVNNREFIYGGIEDFLKRSNSERVNTLIDEIWFDYLKDLELSLKEGVIFLLLTELRSKNDSAHSARIARDIIAKLSGETIAFLSKIKPYGSVPFDFLKGFIEEFSKLPEWMVEYAYQMSKIDIIEKDITLLRVLLPLSLKFEVEHRGFIRIIFPGESERTNTSAGSGLKGGRDVKRLTETSMRRLELLLEREKEKINTFRGRKINNMKVGIELSTKRGRIFTKLKETPLPNIHFIMLLDISSSVRKDNHIYFLLTVLKLIKASLERVDIPFTIFLFNDNIYRSDNLKEEDINNIVKGKTNVEKAIREAVSYARKCSTGAKSVVLVFTDGEPTSGLKGIPLKDFIRTQKKLIPIVGIGLKGVSKVSFYFEETGLEIDNIHQLPTMLADTIEKQIRKVTPLNR